MLKRIEATKNKGTIVNLVRFSLLLLGFVVTAQGYIFEYLLADYGEIQNTPRSLVVSNPQTWLYTGIGILALSLILYLIFKTKKSNFLRPLSLSIVSFCLLYAVFYSITPKVGLSKELNPESALKVAENALFIISGIFLVVFMLGGTLKNKDNKKRTFVNFILISTIITLNLFFLTGTVNNYLNSNNHFRFMGYHNAFFGSLQRDCSLNNIIYYKYNLYPVIEECYFSRYLNGKLPNKSEEYVLKMIYGNYSTYSNFETMPYHIKDMDNDTAVKILQIFYEGLTNAAKNKNQNKTELKFRKSFVDSFKECYNQSKNNPSKEFIYNTVKDGPCERIYYWVADGHHQGYEDTAISIEKMQEFQNIVYNSGQSTLYQIEKDAPEYKMLSFSHAIAYSIQNLYGIYLFIKHSTY